MDLCSLYSKYDSGLSSREILRNAIIEYAYKIINWDKHIDPGDFILEFIPLLDNLIDNFDKEQCNFLYYINKRIKWLKLDINKKNIKVKEKEIAYQSEHNINYLEKVMINELIPDFVITEKAEGFLNIINGKISCKTTKKRFLILILKCSRLLTYDLIKSISHITGESTDWLYNTKEELDKLGEARIKRREYLVLRKNRLFMNIRRDQIRLSQMENSFQKRELEKKLEEKQKRKEDLQRTLNKRSYGPKNEEIAKVLGIPKGTVDSSLFYMKKALKSLFPDIIID